MGHNSVVSGYPKSIGIPGVDGLSMGPPSFGASQHSSCTLCKPKALYLRISF